MLRIPSIPSKTWASILFVLTFCLIASILMIDAAGKTRYKRRRHVNSTTKAREPAPARDDGENLGSLAADLSIRVEKDKPFDIDVWLEPKEKGFQGTAQVFMEQTVAVSYEPRVFTLAAGETKTVKANVQKTFSG